MARHGITDLSLSFVSSQTSARNSASWAIVSAQWTRKPGLWPKLFAKGQSLKSTTSWAFDG